MPDVSCPCPRRPIDATDSTTADEVVLPMLRRPFGGAVTPQADNLCLAHAAANLTLPSSPARLA